jgi:hypothetical protein
MPCQVGSFIANRFPKPSLYEGTIDFVIICPNLLPCVIWRVNADALDFSGVMREQGFECNEVISLDYEISISGFATREFGDVFQQVKRDGIVVVDYGLFAYPVERGHG